MYDWFNFNVLGCIFVEEISLINRNQQWRIQDFLDGGANPKGDVRTYYFGQFYPGKCMKLKKSGPRGGANEMWYHSLDLLHQVFKQFQESFAQFVPR